MTSHVQLVPSCRPNAPFFTGVEAVATAQVHYRHYRSPLRHHIALLELSLLEPDAEPGAAVTPAMAQLAAAELELFRSFSHKRRRVQWLGGRLAVKQAILSLLTKAGGAAPLHYDQLAVLPRASGHPELHLPVAPVNPIAISLSHSDHYAVGLAAEASCCGIDIQKITARIFNVTEKFASTEERRTLARYASQLSEMEQLTLLWAAKEAVKKALIAEQPAIFAGIELLRPIPGDYFQLEFTTPSGHHPTAVVTALQLDNFMLAFTVGGSPHA